MSKDQGVTLSLHYCCETVKTLQLRLVPGKRGNYDLVEFRPELEKTQS